MDISAQLRSHPLFSTFPPDALAAVAAAGRAGSFEAGEACIRSDEAGELFGVLIAGKLEARRDGRVLGVIEPGECFGEMSLLTGTPSGAEVVAVEASEAILFAQEAVSPLLAENPEAVRHLARLITSRLTPKRDRSIRRRPASVSYALGASSPMRVLAVSCRRQEMRYSCFETSQEQAVAWGQVTGIGSSSAELNFRGPDGERNQGVQAATHAAAIEAMFSALTAGGVIESPADLSAIGHRVCHGGTRFDAPVIVDDEVRGEIGRLSALAPMENPSNLAGIEACGAAAEGVPQVAVFDTSFHLTMPPAAFVYAIPDDLGGEQALRRFGGHGISHEQAARDAAAKVGMNLDAMRVLSVHLGSGASIAAIDHGRSVDCTMGLTPLEGLVMATRPGDLDPGLVLFLIQQRGLSPEELGRRLYEDSGLRALAGGSGDMLEILHAAEQGDSRALLALEVFCRRVRKHLGAMLGALGGVDVVVFTGGVGRNAPDLRARICQHLTWMGIALDESANRAADVSPGEVAEISRADSRARVLVAGSNEDYAVACKAVRAVTQQRATEVIRHSDRSIPVAISAHHVHLSQEHVEALFGPGASLTWHADLSQPEQFACKERVALVGPKGRIERVRVLGPVREQTQVEISRTEEFELGIDAPVRMSGDLDGTQGVTLEGPHGRVELIEGVICSMRHIHMSPSDALQFAVRDRDIVRVRLDGERSLIFGDVIVRVNPRYRLEMHLDTDEGNAAELGRNAVGHLDSVQQRGS